MSKFFRRLFMAAVLAHILGMAFTGTSHMPEVHGQGRAAAIYG